MADSKKGRRNPAFDLADPDQKRAYDFLGIVVYEQGYYISAIINKFLKDNHVDDVSKLSRKDIKKMLQSNAEENVDNTTPITEQQLYCMIKKVLSENPEIEALHAKENTKAHEEPLKKQTETKFENNEESDNKTEEDELEEFFDEDLLSGLSSFG